MIISIDSPKHGKVDAIIDDEDYQKIRDWSFYVWTTKRHYGFYLKGYSPDNKKSPKSIHRVIMNAKPGEIVDHINGNSLDNRKSNLRITTSTVNNQNARKRKDGITSRYKGVHWCKRTKKWKAQIQVNKKKKSLGSYDREDDAAFMYNIALDVYKINSPKNIINTKT